MHPPIVVARGCARGAWHQAAAGHQLQEISCCRVGGCALVHASMREVRLEDERSLAPWNIIRGAVQSIRLSQQLATRQCNASTAANASKCAGVTCLPHRILRRECGCFAAPGWAQRVDASTLRRSHSCAGALSAPRYRFDIVFEPLRSASVACPQCVCVVRFRAQHASTLAVTDVRTQRL